MMYLLENMFHLVDTECREEEFVFRLQLMPDCDIYQAHFPGSPITPGVCLVQLVEELLSTVGHRSLRLVEVKNVKFLQVLIPHPQAEVYYKVRYDATQKKASVVVHKDAGIYAKMVLLYA